MKHDQELREAIANPSVYARRLKQKSGGKIVGYVCSYLPEELIIAAGAHPLRLLGTRENIHLADSHLQSYCCSLVRGILEEALSRKSDFLDGMVFPHTCDSIQRLSDIWRMNIPFGFHLDCVLPVKLDTDSAREYMVDVINKFRRDLEGALKVRIADQELKKAIGLTNAIRRRMKEIYELRSKFPSVMPGEELYTLVRASMILERRRVLAILSDIAEELKAKTAGAEQSSSPKRLILAGGICNHPDIYPMIEEAGDAIVGDDFCTGARYFSDEIDETVPPIAGIARRLLDRVVCPAKHADFDGRARQIIRLVKENKAQGVVFLLLKFCDPHAFDFPYLKKSLDEENIPVMLLEIDDPLPAEGQLRTRFEAFLEML